MMMFGCVFGGETLLLFDDDDDGRGAQREHEEG